MKAIVVDGLGEEGKDLSFQIGVGPRLIATVIEEKGVDCDVSWYKMILEDPTKLAGYDAIFVSGFSTGKEIVDSVAEIAHRIDPSSIKILGGPIAFDPFDYFSTSRFNLAVVGEGEKTIQKLLDNGFTGENLSTIEGLAYRDNGKVVFTGYRKPLDKEELERIPDVKYIKAYPFYRYARVSVECVRGCSNFNRPRLVLGDGRVCSDCGNCDSPDLNIRMLCPEGIPPGCGYCCVPGVFGPPRSRKIRIILKEIQELIGAGATKISLSAPDLLDYKREELIDSENLTDPFKPEPNYAALEKLLSEISSLKGVNENVFISIDELKPTLLNDHILEIIAKYLPGSTIILVCESGSMEQLKELGRPFPVKRNVELAKKARDLGLVPLSFFINWLPNQTSERTTATLKFMEELEQNGCQRILCYKLAALPKTSFYGIEVDENEKLNRAIFRKAEEINLKNVKKYLNRKMEVIVVKTDYVFRPKMKKKKGQVKVDSFDCSIGLLKMDAGIYSPIFYIMDRDKKLKAGQLVKVVVDRVMSSRAVRARLATDSEF